MDKIFYELRVYESVEDKNFSWDIILCQKSTGKKSQRVKVWKFQSDLSFSRDSCCFSVDFANGSCSFAEP